MQNWRIEYRAEYTPTPMSFWVHKHLGSEVWADADAYEPSLPKPIPGRGFPILFVAVAEVELQFASMEEVDHFLSVVRQKNMPSTIALSRQRGANHGPNAHWLSRLPARLKSWSRREKLIPLIQRAREDYRRVWPEL